MLAFLSTFFLLSLLFSSGNLFSQSRPANEKGGIGLDDTAPANAHIYQMSFTVRPLSLLVTPLLSGNLIMFNGKVDFVINRKLSFAIEGNYVADEGGFFFGDASGTRYSVRVDLKRYFLNANNPKKYAEGFHVGPYAKYRYSDLFVWGGSETRTSFILGGLIGFQAVSKRGVINPHIGLGLGLGNSNINGVLPEIDGRIGCSIGLVVY